MPDYEHHVFVSYRRLGQWERWVRNMFAPTLRDYLALEFAEPISVYVDDQINTGADWEHSLNSAIYRSRTMVPIFVNPYFSSAGCRKELARMLHREESIGMRSAVHPEGLIYPIRLSSRHYFPDIAKRIQDEDFTSFAIPNLAPNTVTHELFDQSLQAFSKKLAQAIRQAPAHNAAWAHLDGKHHLANLLPKELDIVKPPRMGS